MALKEFCPDHLILLGPGNSLGSAIGQIMIQKNWNGVNNKESFLKKQNDSPYLISMSLNDQQRLITK